VATQCPKCQFDNALDSKFCKECGTQLLPIGEPSVTITLETPAKGLDMGSTFAGRYQIIEVLGTGGMGKVFRALDKKLNEEVAFKLIKPEIASDRKIAERFSNELKLARKIVHKNVARMFDLNEEKGTHYFTMEYVRGDDLKKLLGRIGQLSVEQAVPIAKQICEGLIEAHRLGVVHRDLKPQNIMVDEEGNARIMDFGIARSLGSKGITGAGVMIGTPEYMSPEQVDGKETDQRSDIYSFGIILYEMLTGKVPFEGDTPFAIGMKHHGEDPKDPRKLNAQIPEDLSLVILRCLEKKRENRYQTAADVRSELSRIEEGMPTAERIKPKKKPLTSKEITVTFGLKRRFIPALLFTAVVMVGLLIWSPWKPMESPAVPSVNPFLSGLKKIAVIPFTNIQNDPQTDFLGFALVDQIISDLAYAKNVLTRPSSAVRQYQNQEIDVLTAGRDLDVDFFVLGHYLKEGDVVRLNIELVNVHSNELIWRESIDAQYENVFELQDIVTEKVMAGLKTQFMQDESGRIQTDVPQDPAAYEYYLRSISYPSTNEGEQLAIEMLKKSIELDPNYAPAYDQLGDRTHRLVQYDLLDPEGTKRAEDYFLKALSLNPKLLSALGNLAMIYTETSRIEEAVELTRQMLEINPNNAEAHYSLGYIYRYAGMNKESVIEMEKAVALDPKNQSFRSIILTYLVADEYEKALNALKNYGENAFTLSVHGEVLFRQGKLDQAIEYFDRVIDIEPEGLLGLWVIAMRASLKGNIEEGLKAVQKFEQANIADAEAWNGMAANYALLGDKEGCIRTMKRGVDGGYFNYPRMLADSFLDSVRQDPEFKRILESAKTKHKAFKKRFFSESSKSTK